MAYVSGQAVLQEAGLWHRELAETPAGTVNGTNAVFTVDQKPLADNNYDDEVAAADVTAYVDGTSVTVSAVDSSTGAITLAAAPNTGTDVTIDYSYTSITSTFVTQVIEEASEIIDDELSQVATTPFVDDDDNDIPKRVRLIARTLAAGLLLAREYGLQSDEEGVKQGERKIKLAERWLASYKATLGDNSDDSTEGSPRSSADVRIFQTYSSEDGRWTPLSDENFSLNEVE